MRTAVYVFLSRFQIHSCCFAAFGDITSSRGFIGSDPLKLTQFCTVHVVQLYETPVFVDEAEYKEERAKTGPKMHSWMVPLILRKDNLKHAGLAIQRKVIYAYRTRETQQLCTLSG